VKRIPLTLGVGTLQRVKAAECDQSASVGSIEDDAPLAPSRACADCRVDESGRDAAHRRTGETTTLIIQWLSPSQIPILDTLKIMPTRVGLGKLSAGMGR
jgi:hypothetical protein